MVCRLFKAVNVSFLCVCPCRRVRERQERSWLPVKPICISSEVPSDVVENGKCVPVPACGCAFVFCAGAYMFIVCVQYVPRPTFFSYVSLSPLFVPSPPVLETGIWTPGCIYPSSSTPWAAWDRATGPWSWSTCFCCKFSQIRCRESILCPRNYVVSTSRSGWIHFFAIPYTWLICCSYKSCLCKIVWFAAAGFTLCFSITYYICFTFAFEWFFHY